MLIAKTINLFRKKIISSTGKALKDFSMINHGDKIMVCISGGKDSYTMLEMFIHFQKYGDVDFDFIVVNMDQKQPGFPTELLSKYLSNLKVNFKIIAVDLQASFFDVVEKGDVHENICS